MKYYFSLQYSAIQKTVMRHNRLWSMAGISQGLARLNEIEFVNIVNEPGQPEDFVLVAGGGKFTACFGDPTRAVTARGEIIKCCTTTFPMLEFQASTIVEAEDFTAAKDAGLLEQLSSQKRQLRGTGTTFLPHLAVCEECGEYPSEKKQPCSKKQLKAHACRTCQDAWQMARIDFATLDSKRGLTTLEQIYVGFLKALAEACNKKVVYNFDDFFPKTQGDMADATEKSQRLAFWFSDLNNMNRKVPIWLAQEEKQVLATFRTVLDVNIKVTVEALVKTFEKHLQHDFLPFRLIVAGGDDLCLVMTEEHILSFATNLSEAIEKTVKGLDEDSDNPLNLNWLNDKALPDSNGNLPVIGPYSFGGSFIVTSPSTPFQRIHAVGEKLMSQAKDKSGRKGNSINWRLMDEEESVSDLLYPFERPLAVSDESIFDDRLTFNGYLELRKTFRKVSSSHRFAVLECLRKWRNDPDKLERVLKQYDSGPTVKSFSALLTDESLRHNKKLVPARIATLFELLSIKEGK